MADTKWRKIFLILTFIGLNRAQQFSSFGRRAGGRSVGLGSSFGSGIGQSSGLGSTLPQGSWLSSVPGSASSSSLQTAGSAISRRVSLPSNRLVLGAGSSTLQFPQQTVQQIQPQQIRQTHAVHQPAQTVRTQQRQVFAQPRQIVRQTHVAAQPQVAQTVQQVQPIVPIQQFVQQQPQTVQTAFTGAAVQAPSVGGHVTAQRGAMPGFAPQGLVPGMPVAQNPMGQMGAMGMGSPMGMGMASPMGMGMASPMGMMGAMNPMASMMGMGPMGMGMGMGMGMPFMSYDTMEDLLLDGPDRRAVPMGAAAAAATASRMGAGPAIGAGVRAAIGAPAQAVPVAGQTAAAASVGLGHLSAPGGATTAVGAAAPAFAAPAVPAGMSGAAAHAVDQSVIQSALQTALSRVQQRQAPQTPVVG